MRLNKYIIFGLKLKSSAYTPKIWWIATTLYRLYKLSVIDFKNKACLKKPI
jgi:hypothetical protein